MKNKFFVLISLLSFSWGVSQLNDSVFIPDNQVLDKHLEEIWENPIQFSRAHYQDFTISELAFRHKDFQFKRVQTAGESNDYQFKTSGIFNVNPRLRLLGEFDYHFINEKNIGNTLSNQRTENQFVLEPNYPFVPKKADWDNQKYHIKAGFSYQLKKFDIGATINYENQSSFRKSDPRPEVKTADYSGRLFAGYHLGKHQISGFIGAGRKNDSYTLSSVNENIISPANPDYYVRFSNGYGRSIFYSDFDEYIVRNLNENFGGGYRFQNQTHFLSANYLYSHTLQDLFGQTSYGAVYYDDSLIDFKYRTISHKANLNYMNSNANRKWTVFIEGESITGDNFNMNENGQNYRMTLDRVKMLNQYLKLDKKRTIFGVETEVAYNDFSATDLLAITNRYLQNLTAGFRMNKDLIYTDQFKFNTEIGAMGVFPISSELNYVPSSATTVFHDEVIAKDHAYDSTASLGPQMKLSLFKNITSKTTMKFHAQFASLFAISDEIKNQYHDFDNDPNFIFNFGLSIFY